MLRRPAHRAWLPYVFLAPTFLVYGLFVLLPICHSIQISFYRWASPLSEPVFTGLSNFRSLIQDNVFWWALWHNVLLLLLSLGTQLPLAILIAILLSYPTRCKAILKTSFFAPMVMPTAAIAVLWQFVYAPGDGLLTRLIQVVSPSFDYPWLASPRTALLWIFITICWRYTGFHMVLFLAGIAAIPRDLEEAARLDGASEWQIARHVTLPCLAPVIALSATLSVIGSLKYFDLVYLMGGGIPEESRELMATYIYRLAFEDYQGRFGYGSAAAVFLLLIALTVVIPLQRKRLRT